MQLHDCSFPSLKHIQATLYFSANQHTSSFYSFSTSFRDNVESGQKCVQTDHKTSRECSHQRLKFLFPLFPQTNQNLEELVRVGTRLSSRAHYDFGQCFVHATFGYCGIIMAPLTLRCNHTHDGYEKAYQVLADFNHTGALSSMAHFAPQFKLINDSFELFSVHDIVTQDQIIPMKPLDAVPIYNPFQHHFIDANSMPTALFKESQHRMNNDIIRSGDGGYQGERANQSAECFFALDNDELTSSVSTFTEAECDFKVTSRLVFLGSYDSGSASVDTDKTCVWHMSIMLERFDLSGHRIDGTKLKVIDSKSREEHYDGFFNLRTEFDNDHDSGSLLYKTALLQTTDKFNIKVTVTMGDRDFTVATFNMPFISR